MALAAVVVMVWNVLTEPGIKNIEGDFTEVAFIRNEQNTGPVVRIYAVTLSGDYWKEMEQYGNYMPHTKYGATRVYFFLNDKPFPTKLLLGGRNLEERFKENCIGLYEKDGMSQVSLIKYPFRN